MAEIHSNVHNSSALILFIDYRMYFIDTIDTIVGLRLIDMTVFKQA